jgi:hypothetical protein
LGAWGLTEVNLGYKLYVVKTRIELDHSGCSSRILRGGDIKYEPKPKAVFMFCYFLGYFPNYKNKLRPGHYVIRGAALGFSAAET